MPPASLEDISSISASIFFFQSQPVSMVTVRLKDEQGAGGEAAAREAGWWCVSLTSPSGRRDRTIQATPIQGCCPVLLYQLGRSRLQSCAVHLPSLFCSSSSPTPGTLPRLFLPPPPFSLPLFHFGSRLSLKNAQSSSRVPGDALGPHVLEGQGGMAAPHLTLMMAL